jgi:hypothetical protein
MIRKLVALILLIIPSLSNAQKAGCTDPWAENFHPKNTIYNHACEYKKKNLDCAQYASLPSELKEISGLVYLHESFWAINDGGNEPVLYQLNYQCDSIIHRVRIANAKNKDWEELATDGNNLYIGDFGNNFGSRDRLIIYKVSVASLNDTVATAQLIQFKYADQKDFTKQKHKTNYDCEAMVYWNDTLHLFTKNWGDFKTRQYKVPSKSGTYSVMPSDSLYMGKMITGATVSKDGQTILLTAYDKKTNVDLRLLYGYQGSNFLSGYQRTFELGNFLTIGQVESITYIDSQNIFFSCENFKGLTSQRMYTISLAPFVQRYPSTSYNGNIIDDLSISYTKPDEMLHVDVILNAVDTFDLFFYDIHGKQILEEKGQTFQSGYTQLKYKFASPYLGKYFLVFTRKEKVVGKIPFDFYK